MSKSKYEVWFEDHWFALMGLFLVVLMIGILTNMFQKAALYDINIDKMQMAMNNSYWATPKDCINPILICGPNISDRYHNWQMFNFSIEVKKNSSAFQQ